MSEEKTKFFWCECHSEGVLAEVFEEINFPKEGKSLKEIYLSFWSLGRYHTRKPSFITKLWDCWEILKNGDVTRDDIILSTENAKELGEWLIEKSSYPSGQGSSLQNCSTSVQI